MGLARIEGIEFFGIPVTQSLIQIGRTKGRSKEVNQTLPYRTTAPLTKRRQQLVIGALNRDIYRIIYSLFLRKRLTRKEAEWYRDAMVIALVNAAGQYEPRRRKNGKRATFVSFAVHCILMEVFSVTARLKRDVSIANLRPSDDASDLSNMDFAPDPTSIPERWQDYYPKEFKVEEFAKWEPSRNPYIRFENREKDIFMRWEYAGETLQSIGDFFGITKERARQIAERYRERLKNQFKVYD